MKDIGLEFFSRGGEIPQLIDGLPPKSPIVKMTPKEFEEVLRRPITSHLSDIRELDIISYKYRATPLLRALESKDGKVLAAKILTGDDFWAAYSDQFYSPALDLIEIMTTNGNGDLVVEEAYKRKDKMKEFNFTQIARFAAYSSGRVDEFINHPLLQSDKIWKNEVEGEIQKHLEERQKKLTEKREDLFNQLSGLKLKSDQKKLQVYIKTLNEGELEFLSHLMFWQERDHNLDTAMLDRLLEGRSSVLEWHKGGSRLQLFRDYEGEVYLVNGIFNEPANSWKSIASAKPKIVTPYLKESDADYSDIALHVKKGRYDDQKSVGKRVYSEYVGLSADIGNLGGVPVFLSHKIERMVDNVLGNIYELDYGDHRGYRDNYCYYFVDKKNGIPTIDLEKVYWNLNNFRIVVRRIDLDSMKKLKKG